MHYKFIIQNDIPVFQLGLLLHKFNKIQTNIQTDFPISNNRLGASMVVLRKQEVTFKTSKKLWVAEVLVRKVPDDQQVSCYLVMYFISIPYLSFPFI